MSLRSSVVCSLPFPSNSSNGESVRGSGGGGGGAASQFARSIALGAKGREEGTSLKFISQPPPPPTPPKLTRPRSPMPLLLQIRQTKRKPVSVGSPTQSPSLPLSSSRPSCPKGTRLTHSVLPFGAAAAAQTFG